uniref:Putative sorting and assembly machinery component 50 ovary overexpressed n=1 Tax=Rhipicephalus microplus TaxID=6941 RepID=A0A6M2CZL0_RHIMP
MGTVQAKSLERQEAKDMQVPLDQIEARVDTVFIDGVVRTKDDILKKAVNDLFNAKDFQDVILKTRYVRKQLETLGAFKQISVTIDTSSGPDASPSGLEVTFKVQEVRRLVGGINTLVGNNEGSMVIGLKFPNTWGRGEFVQTEYHYGTKHSSGFNITVSKPFLGWLNPRITGAVFQQAADFTWSGFRQIDRGLLTELLFESTPGVHHSLRWEALWRELSCLGPTVPFVVREEMGHSLKSSIKHIVTMDRRDNSILPTEGGYFRLHQEFAGLGGDIGFVKHEAEYQLNVPIARDIVLQGCCMAGHMMGFGHNKTFSICDRFFLGGPLGLRGFQQRGVGPHTEGHSLGGETYWAAGLHLYTPLPFRPGEGGLGDYFRTHAFATAGNVDDFKFTNDMQKNIELVTQNLRWSVGAGIVLSIGHIARFELNYCVPMKAKSGDRLNHGLQFGIGVSFL